MFDSLERLRRLRAIRRGPLIKRVTYFPKFKELPLRVPVLRAADFLTLVFEFHNLQVENGRAGPVLRRKDAAKPAYMIVEFPSQNIAEEAFLETDEDANGFPVSYKFPEQNEDDPAKDPEYNCWA